MTRKVFLILLALVLALSVGLVACTQPAEEEEEEEEVLTLTEDDEGSSITLQMDQELVISLEGNPTTGYLWEVVELEEEILRPVSVEFNPESELLGAPGEMLLRFAPLEAGLTPLQLAYQRPWEEEPVATYSIDVDVIASSSDSTMNKYLASGSPELPPAFDSQSQVLDNPATDPSAYSVSASLSLPSAFDWRTVVGHIDARDQGGAGTCWAFATVGVLEFNLLMTGITRDISEQYLVSCNNEGWSCRGGHFAHDYHLWVDNPAAKMGPPGEDEPGPVLEGYFPYTASDSPCIACPHDYAIESWNYVGPTEHPSTDQLKEAIYTHGPVACWVTIGNKFINYSGGIFDTNDTTLLGVHGVVLVGWDDTDQVWILRNSWGKKWGENGYMRIKYGTNDVGWRANYIIYPIRTSVPPDQSFVVNIARPFEDKAGWIFAMEDDGRIAGRAFEGGRLATLLGTTKDVLLEVPGLGGVRDTGVEYERKLEIYNLQAYEVVEYDIWYGDTYSQGVVDPGIGKSATIDFPHYHSFAISIARPNPIVGGKAGWIFARENDNRIVGISFPGGGTLATLLGNTKDVLLDIPGLGGVRDTGVEYENKLEVYCSGILLDYTIWYGGTYIHGHVTSGGTATIAFPRYHSFAVNIAHPALGEAGWIFAKENMNDIAGITFLGGMLADLQDITRDQLLSIAGVGGVCDTGVPFEKKLGIYVEDPNQVIEWSMWYGPTYTQGVIGQY